MLTVFIPVVVQVSMTIVILAFLGVSRLSETRKDASLLSKGPNARNHYSTRNQLLANNFDNQFQMPLLFYVGATFALLFGATGFIAGLAAWTFVVARVLHTVVHTTTNFVPRRFLAFLLSAVAVIALWVCVVYAAAQTPWLQAGVSPFDPMVVFE